ncbi:hypothetical protein F3Y22_tig00112402pilonHSYRG00255 [Hibiscus syriacus]|uniref:Endonuclease/exonuclease/phosphatase domain-containing protein n=1 Tax=Hibiscus syriacus TaxID=106335 RepID=A0A6A2YAB7_HIBSY|nr:hypothetical protein F3Y22_tig00112402pilonHSYRG00255 [Hibiscus syriacus]
MSGAWEEMKNSCVSRGGDKSFFSLKRKILPSRIVVLVGTLIHYHLELGLPVIIGGDFNTVKCGGPANVPAMLVLVEFIQTSNLVDLPLEGNCFTWFIGGESVTASRLDRFLISPEVLLSCPNLAQSSLPRSLSDHNPVILKTQEQVISPKSFKWFTHWSDDREYVEMVKSVCGTHSIKGICNKLREVKSATNVWVSNTREKDTESWPDIESRLQALEASLVANGNCHRIKTEI